MLGWWFVGCLGQAAPPTSAPFLNRHRQQQLATWSEWEAEQRCPALQCCLGRRPQQAFWLVLLAAALELVRALVWGFVRALVAGRRTPLQRAGRRRGRPDEPGCESSSCYTVRGGPANLADGQGRCWRQPSAPCHGHSPRKSERRAPRSLPAAAWLFALMLRRRLHAQPTRTVPTTATMMMTSSMMPAVLKKFSSPSPNSAEGTVNLQQHRWLIAVC